MTTETELRFDQTVPCGLAHRRALGEVFVADSNQVGDARYDLAIQIPRAHSLWFDRQARYHDPMSAAEAARQSAFVVVHRYMNVPQGAPFTLRALQLKVEDLGAYVDDERTPLEGVLHMRLTTGTGDPETVGSMSFAGELELDSRLAMTFNGDIVFLPRDDYAALRTFQRRRKSLPNDPPPRVAPLEPHLVGRMDPRNVVIGTPADRAPSSYPIVIDRRHPSFFDHSYDHVPGPLMVEACRQASTISAVRNGVLGSPIAAVTVCDASFTDFAEFEAIVECSVEQVEATPTGGAAAAVGVYQLGKQLAEGAIELHPYPPEAGG